MELPLGIGLVDWQTYFAISVMVFMFYFFFSLTIYVAYMDEMFRDLKFNLFGTRFITAFIQNPYGDFYKKYIPRPNLKNNELILSDKEVDREKLRGNDKVGTIMINPLTDIYKVNGEWHIFVGYEEIGTRKLINEDGVDANALKAQRVLNMSEANKLMLPLDQGGEYYVTPTRVTQHFNAHMVDDVINANREPKNNLEQWAIPVLIIIGIGIIGFAIAKQQGWIGA